jgi:hypothetical protein
VDFRLGPHERLGVLVVVLDEGIDVLLELLEVNEAPVSDLPCRMENQPSTWFSHDARVGV